MSSAGGIPTAGACDTDTIGPLVKVALMFPGK